MRGGFAVVQGKFRGKNELDRFTRLAIGSPVSQTHGKTHVFTIACAATRFRLTVDQKCDIKRDTIAREKIIPLNFAHLGTTVVRPTLASKCQC